MNQKILSQTLLAVGVLVILLGAVFLFRDTPTENAPGIGGGREDVLRFQGKVKEIGNRVLVVDGFYSDSDESRVAILEDVHIQTIDSTEVTRLAFGEEVLAEDGSRPITSTPVLLSDIKVGENIMVRTDRGNRGDATIFASEIQILPPFSN